MRILKFIVGTVSIWIIGLLFFLALGFFGLPSRIKGASNNYFNNFNISFSGIVLENNEVIEGGVGLIAMNLISDSTLSYDVRNDSTMYYCVIKDNKIEVVEWLYNYINIGDSIAFNGISDSCYLYRNYELIKSWKPHLNNNMNIFDEIRNAHSL